METSELVPDNDEHPKRLYGILDLWEEARFETERKRYFCGLIKVGLQYMPVSAKASVPGRKMRI